MTFLLISLFFPFLLLIKAYQIIFLWGGGHGTLYTPAKSWNNKAIQFIIWLHFVHLFIEIYIFLVFRPCYYIWGDWGGWSIVVQSDEKTALILSGHFNEEENGCSNIWGYISFNENIFCVHLFKKKKKKTLMLQIMLYVV